MFFSLFYFYLDPNVSLKQQKKLTFLSIRESLRREKFYFDPSLCSLNAKISRIFRLAKVSAPKVYISTCNLRVATNTTGLSETLHIILIDLNRQL